MDTGVYYSNDGGATWGYNDIYSAATYKDVAVSFTGQYMFALSTSDSKTGNNFRIIGSSNFGGSFSLYQTIAPGPQGTPQFVAVSGSGSHVLTATGNLQDNCGGGKVFVNTIQTLDVNFTLQFISGSASFYGQYMLLASRTCPPFIGKLLVSSNYGTSSSWITELDLSTFSITNSAFYATAMSGSGQYMMAAYYGITSGTNYYAVAISSDYGLNWGLVDVLPSNTAAIDSISISYDGSLFLASIGKVIYYSTNHGTSWSAFYTDSGSFPDNTTWLSLNI